MSISNRWHSEGRVLITEVFGDVTIDEIAAAIQDGTHMADTGKAPVYSLIDVSQLGHFPVRMQDYHGITRQQFSDKLEWVILYGVTNQMVNFIATTITQVIKRNYLVVNTLDDALNVVDKLENGTRAGR